MKVEQQEYGKLENVYLIFNYKLLREMFVQLMFGMLEKCNKNVFFMNW